MYTKEEREGILWEFHRSGMSVAEACRRLPLFPNEWNLRRWLRMEEAGELAAREMPERASRMHCAHGEGSPAYRRACPRPGPAASARTEGRGPDLCVLSTRFEQNGHQFLSSSPTRSGHAF